LILEDSFSLFGYDAWHNHWHLESHGRIVGYGALLFNLTRQLSYENMFAAGDNLRVTLGS